MKKIPLILTLIIFVLLALWISWIGAYLNQRQDQLQKTIALKESLRQQKNSPIEAQTGLELNKPEKLEGVKNGSPEKDEERPLNQSAAKIDGIIFSKDNPSAIINGQIYHLNDPIGKGTLTNIFPEKITIKFPEGEKTFTMEEVIEFP